MTAIGAPQRRSDNLGQRWLPTGGNHARADPSSHHRRKPATATFNDSFNHQPELLPPTGRLINRLGGLCPPALTPPASLKSP
jgi:hypothetical protein